MSFLRSRTSAPGLRGTLAASFAAPAALLVLIALLAACETREHVDAELGAVKKAKEAARQAAVHAGTGVAEEELGVPECDDYLRKVEACANEKVPADDQPAIRFQIDAQRRKWAQMAADPQQRDGLPAECKSATELAQQSMEKYGCAW